MFKTKRSVWIGVAISLVVSLASLGPSVFAATAPAAAAGSKKVSDTAVTQAVTQSYNAPSSVQLGMIVKLVDKDAGSVEPLSQDMLVKILGVVVSPNDTTVTLTPQGSPKQQVFVSASGRTSTLVSNLNGPIRPGDYITASPIAGIGMKADLEQSIVLGKAIVGFSGTSGVINKVSVKDSTGKSSDVALGRIDVALGIVHNPLESKSADYVPSFLSKAAVTVASKPVSTARIYLGLVILLVTAFVTGNLVYSGVRNGMTAIGRNPLSRKSIIKSLIQTVIAGLIIFIVGVLAVYLLLKL